MKKYCTLDIHDVPRRIGRNTHLFALLDEHARDNGSIAVFYDSKASYSIMESPYSPDRISSSATAQKWEHVSLCTKCKSEDYVCWEVMYTLGPLRNRLSIAHYDNGGVTIMPPKGKYVHVIGEKTGDKTRLIVNTDSRKLCDVYDRDEVTNQYGLYCITDDWMSLSALTEDAIESYMYECTHDIKHIVLGRSTDPEMPPILFSCYAYSCFNRRPYTSSALKKFCDKEGVDIIQVCSRAGNDVDDDYLTEVRIVIGHLDSTVFHPSEFGYTPCSNYLVRLDVSKSDYCDEWYATLCMPEVDAISLDNGLVSGHISQDSKFGVSYLSVDPSIEQLMIDEVKRALKESR